jgi:hypothetical protein
MACGTIMEFAWNDRVLWLKFKPGSSQTQAYRITATSTSAVLKKVVTVWNIN